MFINSEFLRNPKVMALEDQAGSEGLVLLMRLWDWCSVHARDIERKEKHPLGFIPYRDHSSVSRYCLRSYHDADVKAVEVMHELSIIISTLEYRTQEVLPDGFLIDWRRWSNVKKIVSGTVTPFPTPFPSGSGKEQAEESHSIAAIKKEFLLAFPELDPAIFDTRSTYIKTRLREGRSVEDLVKAAKGFLFSKYYRGKGVIDPIWPYRSAERLDEMIRQFDCKCRGEDPEGKASPSDVGHSRGSTDFTEKEDDDDA